MNKFIGKVCPYCKGVFTEADEVVICSDCEMPHHKECWISNKGCTTFGCSGTIQGIDFEPDFGISSTPKYEQRDAIQHREEIEEALFCSRCGSKLDSGSGFCAKCGAPIQNMQTYNVSAQNQTIGNIKSKLAETFKTNNTVDPEVTKYIATKSEYYMAQFQQMKGQRKYTSWNTFAFLVSPFWFLFRKMYVFGAIALAVDFVACGILGGIFGLMLPVIVAVASGLFGNYLYLFDLEKRVDRGKNLQEPFKTQYLEQFGDVNPTIPSIAAVVFVLIVVLLRV